MRRVRWVAIVAAAAAILAACSPKASDFRSDAERLLERELAEDPGGTWTATCDEPAVTEADTTFSCTVTDAEGVVRHFTARITGRSEYTVSEDLSLSG